MSDSPDANNAHAAKLQFHYIKGPDYRETVCHGALGGPTPQGKMWVAFYTERSPIPRMMEYTIAGSPDQQIAFNESQAQPSHVDTRHGIIRHIEFSLYMDLAETKRIYEWLGKSIETLEKQAQAK